MKVDDRVVFLNKIKYLLGIFESISYMSIAIVAPSASIAHAC